MGRDVKMSDILKKLAIGCLTFGGLEYVKYRFKGGKPLLEKVRDAAIFLKSVMNDEESVILEAGEFKVE
jgi:hypothetical protein